jgi:hypothetical protein
MIYNDVAYDAYEVEKNLKEQSNKDQDKEEDKNNEETEESKKKAQAKKSQGGFLGCGGSRDVNLPNYALCLVGIR